MLDPLMVHLMVHVTVDQSVSLLELDLVHLMVKMMEILLDLLQFLNSYIKNTMQGIASSAPHHAKSSQEKAQVQLRTWSYTCW